MEAGPRRARGALERSAATDAALVAATGAGVVVGVLLMALVLDGRLRPWPAEVPAPAAAGPAEAPGVAVAGGEEAVRGYLHGTHLVVEAAGRAYPLVAPKLMLSVDALPGGPLLVTVGDMTMFLRIGGRRDLWLDGRSCFLVLAESVRGRAGFYFGCEPPAAEAAAGGPSAGRPSAGGLAAGGLAAGAPVAGGGLPGPSAAGPAALPAPSPAPSPGPSPALPPAARRAVAEPVGTHAL